MYRLSPSDKLKLGKRANQKWKKRLRRKAWGYDRSNSSLEIVAPSVLSFSDNSKETLEFLQKFKSSVFENLPMKKSGGIGPRPTSLDLSKVRQISVPVAVILGAELHRWSLFRSSGLQVRNLDDWTPRLRTLLVSIGVFDLLEMNVKDVAEASKEEIILMKLSSDEKRDGKAVEALQQHVRTLATAYDAKKYVFDAIDEAVVNCLEHGYLKIDDELPRYPYAGHRWWATSCYDPTKDSVRFFVYDQGIGIPKSAPKNEEMWPLITSLLERIGSIPSEAQVIEKAFEVGRTRTQEARRGKGLDKMHRAIRLSEDGYLRILSGCGDLIMGPNGTLKKHDHASHIGGTLVEWSIPVAT